LFDISSTYSKLTDGIAFALFNTKFYLEKEIDDEF